MASTLTENDPEIRDSPTYWFFALEAAMNHGDLRRAAEAQTELERLGITVRYRKPWQHKQREVTNACR